jgi:HlyD family secretion protein
MKNKKVLWITGLLVVLLVAGFVTYRVLANNSASGSEEIQTATVTRGSLDSTLSSSGNTRTGQSAIITWQTSGRVGEVTLQPGDVVQKSQTLATLDLDSLVTEMIKARQDLIDAQQAYEDLMNSTLQQAQALQAVENAQKALDSLKQTAAEDSSQAQLALANAQIALEDAQKTRTKMDYPHSTDKLIIEKAQTDYLLAKQRYKEALSAYNALKHRNLTNPERVQALNNLVAAKAKMDVAFATYNWYLLNYTDEDIAQADGELAVAQANLETAQANWDALKNGTSATAITLAEAILADAQRAYERVKDGPSEDDVASAQAAIDAAQAVLDKAQLLAPFAGTITEVDVNTGDLANAGDTAFRIDDMDSLYIDLQISEVDLANLEVGQKATLEFDAIEGKTYDGEVTEIGMIGAVSQGVVNYPATIRITNVDEDLLPGMTALVNIITAQADNVLLVPNKAIRNSGGQQTVTVLFEGQQFSIPVSVGLVGDTMSEVLSDQLREGDTVVVSGSTSTSSTTDGQFHLDFGGGFVIEGNGPPPGMP